MRIHWLGTDSDFLTNRVTGLGFLFRSRNGILMPAFPTICFLSLWLLLSYLLRHTYREPYRGGSPETVLSPDRNLFFLIAGMEAMQ
jgi:hypothetical protein